MNLREERPPIYVVGPTASGKSELAVALARRLNGVIISADSMQLYRGLDIGTAKESAEVLNSIPHKMIDIIDVNEEFSVAEYALRARQEITQAQRQGLFPIVVGGTGLYFEALFYPMSFGNSPKNPQLRAKLQSDLEAKGPAFLHKQLEELDATTAQRLHENDTKRVIRALEVVLTSGRPLSRVLDERENAAPVIALGLNTERAKLYAKINDRVDKMFELGLVNEALAVQNFSYQSMQAIGYKEFKDCSFEKNCDGKYVLDEAETERVKALIKQHTRNYAKRQLTWFRKYDFVKWFDCADFDQAIAYAENAVLKTVE